MTGIGLRLPHLAEVAATHPRVSWLEIHPENFLANPHAAELLEVIAGAYPISVHTVGVSVGSADGVDRAHLARVRQFVDGLRPFLVSGHLAWSTHAGEYLNDLLPLPYTEETLRVVSAHVRQVQDALGRPFLVENPSNYVGFSGSTMTEPEFLNRLVDQTACQLLCDVSNIVVSAHNMGYDACSYLDQLPPSAIGELHLGGFSPEADETGAGGTILVDTHATPVSDAAWQLYTRAIQRFGDVPTLIEWDADIPALATLVDEARKSESIAARELTHAVAR